MQELFEIEMGRAPRRYGKQRRIIFEVNGSTITYIFQEAFIPDHCETNKEGKEKKLALIIDIAR